MSDATKESSRAVGPLGEVRWVTRWNDVIASKPDLPGVWRRKEGGFRIRGRFVDARTSAIRGINRALPDCKRARDAAATLAAEIRAKRKDETLGTRAAAPRFDEWALTVFERKVKSGAIASARSRDKWDWVLRVHLFPAFGPLMVDKITREDIETWKADELLAERTKTKDAKRDRKLAGKRYRPQTANVILGILRIVMSEAAESFNFNDPCRRIENANKREHKTYTYEHPNSLKPADVPRFLDEMRMRFPEHYAFVFLGFTTGLRPSSLRPLRARGPDADVKWDEGRLLIRRSHTRGREVMDSTKTGTDQVIDLDERQLDILRWHLERLEADNARREKRQPRGSRPEVTAGMRESDLLFPAPPSRWYPGGSFRSASCLDKPFEVVGRVLGLGYSVSPRAMRRTFQDLARAASVGDIVTRAISGHATAEMQRHYSTVAGDEQRNALAKVIDIATGRERDAA